MEKAKYIVLFSYHWQAPRRQQGLSLADGIIMRRSRPCFASSIKSPPDLVREIRAALEASLELIFHSNLSLSL